MLKRTAVIASLVSALVLGASAAGLAGNGNGANKPSSSSITLVLMTASTATAATSGPNYGDTVTFSISTTATSQPFVHLKCYQNGKFVLEAWQGFFDTALGHQSFNLGPSPAWQGGAADCTAYLENWDSYSKNGRTQTLASTTFHVGA